MAAAVIMPQVGISVETCVITEWLKKPGDTVEVGDILFTYETDKASLECESTEAGTLLEIFYQNGDEVPVRYNVCAIGNPGDDISALRPECTESVSTESKETSANPTETTPPAEMATPAPSPTTPAPLEGDIKISPRAKNLAADQNIDLRLASPSGPYGRIIERDIRTMIEQGIGSTSAAFDAVRDGAPGQFVGTAIGGRVGIADLSAAPAAMDAVVPAQEGPAYEDVVFSGIRKVISKSMTASLSNIPQLTHSFSFDASEMLAYRSKLKSNGEALGLPNITLNDIILYAVSRILPKYPALNAHMLDATTIRYFKDVHLGMAVDTERGLLVPVIQYANRKSLAQIAIEAKELAKQAQAGTLSPDDMSGGTFTVSNLGSLGVEHFTPVINPPQTGILGVNNIQKRPREVGGQIQLYSAMGISLTYDHRAIDGAPASRFAQELCKNLESFTLLLSR